MKGRVNRCRGRIPVGSLFSVFAQQAEPERINSHCTIALHDLPSVVHKDQIGSSHPPKRFSPRIHPSLVNQCIGGIVISGFYLPIAIRIYRVPHATMSSDTFAVSIFCQYPKDSCQMFFSVNSLFNWRVESWQNRTRTALR